MIIFYNGVSVLLRERKIQTASGGIVWFVMVKDCPQEKCYPNPKAVFDHPNKEEKIILLLNVQKAAHLLAASKIYHILTHLSNYGLVLNLDEKPLRLNDSFLLETLPYTTTTIVPLE